MVTASVPRLAADATALLNCGKMEMERSVDLHGQACANLIVSTGIWQFVLSFCRTAGEHTPFSNPVEAEIHLSHSDEQLPASCTFQLKDSRKFMYAGLATRLLTLKVKTCHSPAQYTSFSPSGSSSPGG